MVACILPHRSVAQDSPDRAATRYIVALTSPPLASYSGGIAGLPATRPETIRQTNPEHYAGVHVDPLSPDAKLYLTYLREQQDRVIARIRYFAPEFLGPEWRYFTVLNGFEANLTYRHADLVRGLSNVLLVYPEERFKEELDGSTNVIGAPSAWLDGNGFATAGLNARVGILEAGNAVHHPFLNDDGMPPPMDGYPVARYHLANGQSGELKPLSNLVNRKLIAFQLFANRLSDEDIEAFEQGQRITSHGTHIAGIIAGRTGNYNILPGWSTHMSGIAPMATIFSYPIVGGTPEIVAALDTAASQDQLDAMNISMGTATWLLDAPDEHPIALAAAGASDAGMVIVTSAGNEGSRLSMSLTGSWKYSEHVLAVSSSSSSARSGVAIKVDSADIPIALEAMRAGVFVPSESAVTAPAVVIEDTCKPQSGLMGRIAVVEWITEGNAYAANCGLLKSSQYLRDAGATAIIYLYLGDLVGQHGLQELPPEWSPIMTSFTLGYSEGKALRAYMVEHQDTVLTISSNPQRSLDAPVDIMDGSASTGPGLNGSIKPDLSAPGINILSSIVQNTTKSGSQDTPSAQWAEFTGTSMAAAHASGAIALLRSRHPTWTAGQIRSALLSTTDSTLLQGIPSRLEPASPVQSGVGRLNVSRAMNPGITLDPPKAAFGNVTKGARTSLTVTASAISRETTSWSLSSIPSAGQDSAITILPETFIVAPGHPVSLTLMVDTAVLTNSHTFGIVRFTERSRPILPPTSYLPALLAPSFALTSPTSSAVQGDGVQGPLEENDDHPSSSWTSRVLSLSYSIHIKDPKIHRNVLMVDWTPDEISGHHRVYERALDYIGLGYTDWWVGASSWGSPRQNQVDHPSLDTLRDHDLVIINTNESKKSIGFPYSIGLYQYFNYLDTGGSLLITGQGAPSFWRSLSATRYRSTAPERLTFPETFPFVWNTPGQGFSCDICLTRYFAGFTPELTATLSGRLLLPFGTKPDRPNALVLLRPHPDAEPDSPFAQYSVDISTGNMAVGGAAGNQYTFASGDVMREYRPTAQDDPDTIVDESMLAANLGDVDDAAWTRTPASRAQLIPDYARPLWTFPVNGQPKVVGTYIAGKQHPESRIPWNAMFWGFGLEGVGKSDDDTVTPEQLLGDAFNFLARNVQPQAALNKDAAGAPTIRVSLGATAAPLRFTRAEVEWVEGFPETYTFDPPKSAVDITLKPDLSIDPGDLSPVVPVVLYPIRGSAAPIHFRAR